MNNHDWSHGTFLSPEAAAQRPPRYRIKTAAPDNPTTDNSGRHPHWFCAQLRQILSRHPEAHRTVCEWLARLEEEGHVFTS